MTKFNMAEMGNSGIYQLSMPLNPTKQGFSTLFIKFVCKLIENSLTYHLELHDWKMNMS